MVSLPSSSDPLLKIMKTLLNEYKILYENLFLSSLFYANRTQVWIRNSKNVWKCSYIRKLSKIVIQMRVQIEKIE